MKELKTVARSAARMIATLMSYAGFWWLLSCADIEYELEDIGISGAPAIILMVAVVAIVSYVAVGKIVREFRFMLH